MVNKVDEAIVAYIQDRNDALFFEMYQVLLTESLYLPISEGPKEVCLGCLDVPVVCVRTETGAGAIPAFTSMEHLFKWKPQGCTYACITGRKLIEMAIGMSDISEISINYNDVPRGRIPREHFERMLVI